MAENGDGAVEGQLRHAGRRLLQPLPSVQELIHLLDQVAHWLSRLELESPRDLEASISPLPKALVSDELVWHQSPDVVVAVTCCLCEILRITSPEPYYPDNETLKVVLELIVHSLKYLGDTSSPSHNRRIKILELVSNHRFGALMLDYDCEVLAAEMFEIFIDTIRDDQPDNFFYLMENAMTEVLELFNDDEDISAELISPLLAALRKENQEVHPVAVDLAKNVIINCADKLRPHIVEAIKYLDTSMDDYSDFVASICEDSSGSESDGSHSASDMDED